MNREWAVRAMTRDERRALREDIHEVNSGVLDAVTEPEIAGWVQRRWRVLTTTRAAVRSMSEATRSRVARSDAPLYRLRVPEPAGRFAHEVPPLISRLQLRALLSVQRAGLVDPVATATLFRVRVEDVERLGGWCVGTLETAASREPDVVRLRCPGGTAFWEKIGEGGRIGGDLGKHLVYTLAMMGAD